MCEEMLKFRNILDNNNIEWKDMSETWPAVAQLKEETINRTHFYINGIFVSVINGFCTHGGEDILTHKNLGLLEMMCKEIDADPIGYLTAEECWSEIQPLLKSE